MVNIDYKKLIFYKKAHELTIEIYKITKEFPKDELYSLTNQMRRCSVSMGSNIAEATGRNSIKECINFLHYCLGSCKELEYQLLISKDLNYISSRTYDRLSSLLDEVIGSLKNYMKKIKC